MEFITVKELREKTKAVLQKVRSGKQIIVTYRGKPIAIVSPFEMEDLDKKELRPFEEAWADIEATLDKTSPQFLDWKEAIKHSRRE